MSRVLHLRSSSGFWGPERQIHQLAGPLVREGFEPVILVLFRPRDHRPQTHPLVQAMRKSGFEAHQIQDNSRLSPRVIRHIVNRLKSTEIALLHTHEYKSDVLGGIAARLAGVRCVASVRGYTDSTWTLHLYKYIDFVALRLFTKIIAVSDHVRRQIITAGIPEDRVVTIHDGVDRAAFVAEASQADPRPELFSADSGARIVCTVGRLSAEKGHSTLLYSARQVLGAVPDVRFLIVGEGPLRRRLEYQARSLGLDEAVIFAGYQRDVAGLLGVSDVVVQPSQREGFGNVLIEAMALGKPVVASSVGGIPEIVRHGQTGLLSPPGNAQALAEAIVHVLMHPREAETMGVKGRERVERRFTIESTAKGIAEVYREVLGGAG